MVLKFIRCLLVSPKAEQDKYFARQIPLGVFKTHQAELTWIYDYRESNRKFPTLSRFKRRFTRTKLIRSKETLDETIQEVLDHDIFERLTTHISEGRTQYESGKSISEVVNSMRSNLSGMQMFDTSYVDARAGDVKAVIGRYMDKYNRYLDDPNSKQFAPWPALVEMLGSFDPGDVFILASRTSIGKTWISLAWAMHQAKMGEQVLFISKEMTTAKIHDRIVAATYQISYSGLKDGELSPKDLRKLRSPTRAKKLKTILDRLVITGQETLTGVGFEHVFAKIQQYTPTCVWIDGAYLITPDGLSRNAGMADRAAAIAGTMKRIAKHFNLKVCGSIQAKRESENKSGDADSRLTDLFGGDAWAQDADVVALLNGRRGADTRRILIAKSRDSNIGEIGVKFTIEPFPSFKQTIVPASMSATSGGASVPFKAF